VDEPAKQASIRERAEVKGALLDVLCGALGPVRARDAAALVAAKLDVTAHERAIPRSSGKPTKWDNEVQWAYQDLKREGLARALHAGLWSAREGG
jgi:restriction endonuclease Mrr